MLSVTTPNGDFESSESGTKFCTVSMLSKNKEASRDGTKTLT